MKHLTDVVNLLDCSFSMQNVRSSTIEGFNSFLAEQRSDPSPATISLYQFSTPEHFVATYTECQLAMAPALNMDNYNPTGRSTALLDAMGKVIDQTGHRLARKSEHDRPDKVVIVIMTDGQENDSKRETWEAIASRIAHQQDKYKWSFVYVGANQDAIANANRLCIPTSNAFNYVADHVGTKHAYQGISQAVYCCRSGASMDLKSYDAGANAQPSLFSSNSTGEGNISKVAHKKGLRSAEPAGVVQQ